MLEFKIFGGQKIRIFYLNFHFSTNVAVPWWPHTTRPLHPPKPPIPSTLHVPEDEGTAVLKISIFTS
jgi:hypothetical protein